ncbi:hypothetical protein PHET_06536 [Paragonimus heterotremus]|uniref:LisH domain-containing protein n=1 Tax=Paragonimus heterotremus TaxID=100268 RepID=A0A8J4WHA8_9TREM|nr:hypothetical protein PHET_06536 [Paragonimus heterotremus]
MGSYPDCRPSLEQRCSWLWRSTTIMNGCRMQMKAYDRLTLRKMQGRIVLSFLVEFLKLYNLDSTLEVFEHETELNHASLIRRDDLHSLFNLVPNSNVPALTTLLQSYSKMCRLSPVNTAPGERLGSADNSEHLRRSKIPIMRNRRASAPISHAQSHQRNGYGDTPESPRTASIASETSPSLSNHPLDSVAMNGTDSLKSEKYTGLSEPAATRLSERVPTVQNSTVTNLREEERSTMSPFRHTISPRDQDYQDDFDSPRSLSSQKTLSTVSSREDTDRKSTTHSPEAPQVSFHAIGAARSGTPVNSSSPGIAESASRPSSRSGTPSVIRIYSRASLRTPVDNNSDIDEEDDVGEEIQEVLKEYSVGEDSVDQTIDSDESLGLDHVEEVRMQRNRTTLSN